jgi:hypothetical protein
MNRPRLARPSGLPAEVWLVIGLLCGAGLFTGVPVLRALPDAFELLTDGGLWDSVGPLVLVLLVELGLVAAACFVLAWLLSQRDPVARLVAVAVSGSLAFGLLVGDVLDGTSATVTLLCSLAVVVCLTLLPGARAFFASRPSPGPSPRPVVAAEVIVVMLSGVLLATGVAYLPLAPLEAKFAVVGLVLIAISVAGFRVRRRLQTADTPARTLVTALMAGAVVAILVGADGAFTGPLYVPLALAVTVVALLWLPQASQAYFGSAPKGGGMGAARLGLPRIGLPRPGRPPAPVPPDPVLLASGESPPSDDSPPPLSDFAPSPPPSDFAPSSAPPQSGPATSRPATSPASGSRLPPPAATRSSPSRETSDSRPSATSAPMTPPAWLLDAPPVGFWPPERPRPEPRQFEMLDLGPTTPDEVRDSPALGIRFDTTSWFPVLEGREQVRGAYLVSMVMFDDGGVDAVFRGTSTLLVTSSRLLGVCPRGESDEGPLDGAAGRVAVWSIQLDELDWVRTDAAADNGHLVLKGDPDDPWARLAKARVAADGAFQPCSLGELADVVNRAKHSSA